ncbi:unnamed protein product [Albugo candida]|uniref:Uncharacterized protein n=1 Tax=Albugo candida TaxID=65357 RepID=A0A024GHS8_9STRA|nr:unnamed protein product [Albugo candida]|eukprot:CCI46330.1 unnamed protein product [Albugo candida]
MSTVYVTLDQGSDTGHGNGPLTYACFIYSKGDEASLFKAYSGQKFSHYLVETAEHTEAHDQVDRARRILYFKFEENENCSCSDSPYLSQQSNLNSNEFYSLQENSLLRRGMIIQYIQKALFSHKNTTKINRTSC